MREAKLLRHGCDKIAREVNGAAHMCDNNCAVMRSNGGGGGAVRTRTVNNQSRPPF